MMSSSRLASWVRRSPANTDSFQLHFISGDDTSELLQTWAKSEAREKTEAFCDAVLQLCQDDCNEERELESRYRLLAFAGEKPVSSQTIRVKPTEDKSLEDPLGIGSSAGHSTNAQLVRMNEVMLRMFVSSLKGTFDGYKQLLEAQAAEIVSLRSQQMEMQQAVQVAAIKQLDIDGDEQRSQVALQKLGGFLEKYAPEFISAFAGKVAENGVPEV